MAACAGWMAGCSAVAEAKAAATAAVAFFCAAVSVATGLVQRTTAVVGGYCRIMPLHYVKNEREMLHIVLAAGSVWDVQVALTSSQRISATFMVDMGDVDFEVICVHGASLTSDIYRLSAQLPTETLESTVRCRHASFQFRARSEGCILLRFSNQHSWTRSKSLRLSVDTTAPDAAPPGASEQDKSIGGVRHQAAIETTISLEQKLSSWLATIPIGAPGAEGATSTRAYDPSPLIAFAQREELENESADEIYRLWVEHQIEEAELRMIEQGMEVPVEPDNDLLELGAYCLQLDESALHSSRMRRKLEERLRSSMELHSTFLIGAFHGVQWDWVSSRFIGVPAVEAVWKIGEACQEWAKSPHRVKQQKARSKSEQRLARRNRATRNRADATLQPEVLNDEIAASTTGAFETCSDHAATVTTSAGHDSEQPVRIPKTDLERRPGGSVVGDTSLAMEPEAESAAATLYIAAGSSKDFPVYIGEGGAKVEWQLDVTGLGGPLEALGDWTPFIDLEEEQSADVSFEAIFLAGATSAARMYSAEAVQNVTGQERCKSRAGELTARMRGILLLRFDNTFSWARRKVVRLRWTVTPVTSELSPRSPYTPRSPASASPEQVTNPAYVSPDSTASGSVDDSMHEQADAIACPNEGTDKQRGPSCVESGFEPVAPVLPVSPVRSALSVFEETINVSAGSSRDVAIAVTADSNRVEYHWSVHGGDIAFSALFVPGSTHATTVYRDSRDVDVVQVSPTQRQLTDTGCYMPAEAGVVLLRFDNSYSWLRRKHVQLHIEQMQATPICSQAST